MPGQATRYLTRQFDIAWKLTAYQLDGLSTEECQWRPAEHGPHVHQAPDGRWVADWPDHEDYDLGPASVAWLTWHLGFWWSMLLDHSVGEGELEREQVYWPGSAEAVREWIQELGDQWRSVLDGLTDAKLRSERRTRWPFTSRPFGDVVAWANVELMKSAAEIGYVRFLYAARPAAVS